jgi:phosphopantetheinyl transferase
MLLKLPPLIPWNATAANRCTLEQIIPHWKDNETLTFFVDHGVCHPSFRTFLDAGEKEQELRYKTDVSRTRFVVSRTLLKHILKPVLDTPTPSDVILHKKKYGRILIKDVPGLFISLSYSGTSLAITIGKQKIGSDIEVLRTVDIRKIRTHPLFYRSGVLAEKDRTRHFLQVWTLLEAYAKLRDRNTYACLAENNFPPEVNFVSYCINNASIFSLAFGPDTGKHALLWLDPAGIGTSSEF